MAAVLFAVVSAGHRLAGYSGAEFVIEIPKGADTATLGAEVESVVTQAAAELPWETCRSIARFDPVTGKAVTGK